jgi:conjugal transfer mating pair stabilization protein TraG
LARSTGRNDAQVEHALAIYHAASQLGTADGANAEAAREHTSIYGRSREAFRYDFAEVGRLDAQREVGPAGTRSAARIGEARRQADNAGFARGAAAADASVRAKPRGSTVSFRRWPHGGQSDRYGGRRR